MLYTSVHGNYDYIPEEYSKVSISITPPNWWKGLHYKELCPPWSVYGSFRNADEVRSFCKDYRNKLSKLDAFTVQYNLYRLVESDDIVLCSYEAQTCTLIKEWFEDNGMECEILTLH